eukprot:NODE_2445_length_923_cov_2165.319222_g2012_i0.p3 GENE.NODE_2445_length_923_cov_2165.319222_g2012_i0~~NODE_2445_length_923_cov_2165.319222_g2012_i0.p3  ORF type:complete len:146 (-),score=29.03 NODE_2445_length_923_cov_2165.319222_g2012_i0:295-732(-)
MVNQQQSNPMTNPQIPMLRQTPIGQLYLLVSQPQMPGSQPYSRTWVPWDDRPSMADNQTLMPGNQRWMPCGQIPMLWQMSIGQLYVLISQTRLPVSIQRRVPIDRPTMLSQYNQSRVPDNRPSMADNQPLMPGNQPWMLYNQAEM